MPNSGTKCPICNTENPPDASACSQCGFGLILTGPLWPDSAPVETSEPQDRPSAVEAPKAEPPPPPKDNGPPVVTREEVAKTPDNNERARVHIANGFQALRAKSYRRARREFERARDLADDPDIVRMAQAQLSELSKPSQEARREPVRRPMPAPQPAVSQVEGADWMPAARIGLIASLISGVLSACGAVFFLGALIMPIAGFIAGWWAARQANQEARPTNASHALIAGAIISLSGGLAQIIGYTIWMEILPDVQFDSSTLLCVSCTLGTCYTALTIPLSLLGWRLKASR